MARHTCVCARSRPIVNARVLPRDPLFFFFFFFSFATAVLSRYFWNRESFGFFFFSSRVDELGDVVVCLVPVACLFAKLLPCISPVTMIS